MPTLEFSCDLNAPIERVWAFYDTIESLFALTPPSVQVRLEGEPVPMRAGVIYPLRMRRSGIAFHWDAKITAHEPPTRFVDQQVPGRGPFAFWQHEHLFTALSKENTRITDRVTYTPPFGLLGRIADTLFIRRELNKMFAYRHRITREKVEKP